MRKTEAPCPSAPESGTEWRFGTTAAPWCDTYLHGRCLASCEGTASGTNCFVVLRMLRCSGSRQPLPEHGQQLPAYPHGGQEGKETSPQLKDSEWLYGKLPQDQRKLETRTRTLLFSCRREGLFHPMGNKLDKNKLIIYQCSFQLFVGCHTPPPSLGWDGLVTQVVLTLGAGPRSSVLGWDHPWLINSRQ